MQINQQLIVTQEIGTYNGPPDCRHNKTPIVYTAETKIHPQRSETVNGYRCSVGSDQPDIGGGLDLVQLTPTLQSDDIAEAILYVLRAPANVETNDIIIRSVEQPA
ncbi:Uncharacterised protein r2_g789 [Pycnogonum litorale]